jgi:hypothetical protein
MEMEENYKNLTESSLEQKRTNEQDTDFKPEVVVASLMEQGYNPEQIHIIREGYGRRGFSKEVEEIQLKYSLHNRMDMLHVRINREGIYDMLPQGLFHQPLYRKRLDPDKEDVLYEINVHRQEEFFARKFFQAFEIVADETLTDAFLLDIKLHKKISYSDFVDMFRPYWHVLNRLTPEQANIFLYIIPIMHRIQSQREESEKVLSVLLDVPVSITNIKLPAKKADRSFSSTLGDCRLGVDFVLGDSFDDGESDLKITLGPISSRRMIDFIEGHKDYELLEILCDMFLPASAFVVKEFKILPEDSAFILSDENTTTFLGINSFI